jgi:hypothetical protein
MIGISNGRKIYTKEAVTKKHKRVNNTLPFPEIVPESLPAVVASKRAFEGNHKPNPFQSFNF